MQQHAPAVTAVPCRGPATHLSGVLVSGDVFRSETPARLRQKIFLAVRTSDRLRFGNAMRCSLRPVGRWCCLLAVWHAWFGFMYGTGWCQYICM